MPYAALIDACVLYNFSTRDILLRIAERGLFRPVWSIEILDETTRNLEANGVPAARLREILERTFEDALVTGGGREFLASVPDAISFKDRHVVAAAVAGHADVIVTFNTRDFPADALALLGLDIQTPDEFLLDQLAINQYRVVQALREQAAQLRKPPMSLEALALHVPNFAAMARALLSVEEPPPETPT